jgi:hypothetical protein
MAPPRLRRVDLDAIRLRNGTWVEVLDALRQKSYPRLRVPWQVQVQNPWGGEFEDMDLYKRRNFVEDLFTTGCVWEQPWVGSAVVRYIRRDLEDNPLRAALQQHPNKAKFEAAASW